MLCQYVKSGRKHSVTIKLTQDIQFRCVMTKLSLGSVPITYGVLGSVEVQ